MIKVESGSFAALVRSYKKSLNMLAVLQHICEDNCVELSMRPAPAVAALHLIVQAGPLPADVAREFFGAARQAERRTQGVDDLLRAPAAAVGAEIARAVVRDARGQRDDGIVLAHQQVGSSQG